MAASSETMRVVIVENPNGAYLAHIRTRANDLLPLTNPGHYAYGTHIAYIHAAEGTATIRKEES